MSVKEAVGQRPMAHRDRLNRIRDFVVYTLVGVGAVAAVAGVALFTAMRLDQAFKWLGFAVMTAIVFGGAIHMNRRWWRIPRFWLLLSSFLAVQSALGAAILSAVTKVYTIVWAVLIPLDYFALGAYLAFCLDSRRKRGPL